MRPLYPVHPRAKSAGLRAVISTNGTLITEEVADVLKDIGLSYVGVSIDGMRDVNDRFRGVKGAFDNAMQGIRNCLKAGVKVGLRFTINKMNVEKFPVYSDCLKMENIPACMFLPSGVCGPRK